MTKDTDGTSYSPTNLMIWWWYKKPVSFFAPSGMTGFLVVVDRLRNPIRWNKFFVVDVFSRSSTFRFLSSLFAIRACAIAIATTVFATPPFFRKACRYFMTFSSIFDPRLTFAELVKPRSYFFRWSQTVLSSTEYFRAAREFPWIKAYLPIFSISSLVNVTNFLFFGMFEIEVETASNYTAPTPMSSFDISVAEVEPVKQDERQFKPKLPFSYT